MLMTLSSYHETHEAFHSQALSVLYLGLCAYFRIQRLASNIDLFRTVQMKRAYRRYSCILFSWTVNLHFDFPLRKMGWKLLLSDETLGASLH